MGGEAKPQKRTSDSRGNEDVGSFLESPSKKSKTPTKRDSTASSSSHHEDCVAGPSSYSRPTPPKSRKGSGGDRGKRPVNRALELTTTQYMKPSAEPKPSSSKVVLPECEPGPSTRISPVKLPKVKLPDCQPGPSSRISPVKLPKVKLPDCQPGPSSRISPAKLPKVILPDCQPGPSGLNSSSQGVSYLSRESELPAGTFFMNTSPCYIQQILAQQSPYLWGQIVSDAFELSGREKNIRQSHIHLGDARRQQADADEEPNELLKAKKSLRAAALFAVGANRLEDFESSYPEARDTYARTVELVERTRQLVQRGDSRQHKRLEILCLKFKAWLEYRLYWAKQYTSVSITLPESKQMFGDLASALQLLGVSDRPPETKLPLNLLLDIKNDLMAFDQLHQAFRLWTYADSVIAAHQDEGFFEAAESAIARSVKLLSRTEHFVKYVREFIQRAERFSDTHGKNKKT